MEEHLLGDDDFFPQMMQEFICYSTFRKVYRGVTGA